MTRCSRSKAGSWTSAAARCTTSTRARDRPSCSCTATRPGRSCTATSSTCCATASAASRYHPGFGLSSAPSTYGFTPAEHAHTVERFILEHDLGQLTVMGHDWGGPIGLGAASRHPDRIAAVIVANTWAWPANSSPFLQGFSRLAGGPPGRVLIERYNSFVELSMPLGTARTRVAPKVMEHYRRPFADPAARRPTWVFPRAILKSHNYLLEVERGLSRLADRPALILWGTRDVAFRGSARRRFERAFPNHRTILLRGAGHYIQEDASAEIADAISVWHPLAPKRSRAIT